MELGRFLRSRREAVSPADVGLPVGPRRRTPGLRRAELATLAHPADAMLHHFFRAHREIGAQDRAFIAEGAFTYLRRRRSLTALAQSDDPRLLALAVVVRHFHATVRDLEGFLNTRESVWLAAFKSRLDTPLDRVVDADLPDWLWQRLGAPLTEEHAQLTHA